MPFIDMPVMIGICLFIGVALLGVITLLGSADTGKSRNSKK